MVVDWRWHIRPAQRGPFDKSHVTAFEEVSFLHFTLNLWPRLRVSAADKVNQVDVVVHKTERTSKYQQADSNPHRPVSKTLDLFSNYWRWSQSPNINGKNFTQQPTSQQQNSDQTQNTHPQVTTSDRKINAHNTIKHDHKIDFGDWNEITVTAAAGAGYSIMVTHTKVKIWTSQNCRLASGSKINTHNKIRIKNRIYWQDWNGMAV